MNFNKFSSIENVDRQKYIDKIVTEGKANQEFVATEKAHGANYSMYFDGVEFKHASRSGFISLDSNFYGIQNHIEYLKDKMIKLYNILGGDGLVSVYGEWFGGFYPDNVSPAGTKKVQKEVCYCPHNDFYGFDIVKDGKHLSVDERNKAFDDAEFIYAKILYRGTLQECLDYPNDFITTIPSYFGLPEIEGNIAEGTVIEPVEYCTYSTGSRIILKNKNKKFKENKKDGSAKVKEIVNISDENKPILEWLLGCANENRLNAVVSKFDHLDDKSFGRVMGAMMMDIVDDYRNEFEKEIEDGIDDKEAKQIKKHLGKEVQLLIRENFVEILDRFGE